MSSINLTPARWAPGEGEKSMNEQLTMRPSAGSASGKQGAVAVAYNAWAARAGLEALRQGGTAVDAAMTAAMAQVALTAGSPISYFGILSLVYYEAKTGKVHTMNAEWNTVLAEADPRSIPGGINFGSEAALRGTAVSGRTALVGGFMRGVEAAHKKFGKLPFASLFGPAIEVADKGMPVTKMLEGQFEFRKDDLARLPETRETFLKPDGSIHKAGEIFRQPRLAETLRQIAKNGANYMYDGPWAKKAIAAIQSDGGKMTLEDLRRYQPIWSDPLIGALDGGYAIYTSPWPNAGGVGMIEAQNLAAVSGLATGPHWTKSPESLVKAVEISQQLFITYLPEAARNALYPGIDLSPASRVTRETAAKIWARMELGAKVANFQRTAPKHSDDVVAIDAEGNIAAITQSINCVFWGRTAIVIDGISVGDPASFQQAQIAEVKPGDRLPAPTETGILFKDGKPVIGFASMGAGLHQRTFQCLLNVMRYGMSVDQALDTPDFYLPETDPKTGQLTLTVPQGVFDKAVLDGTGLVWREVPADEARLGGQGEWVAISRDPASGTLRAASPNRVNGDAVAF